MKTEFDAVNACVQRERIDIGKHTIEEVSTDAALLPIVKPPTGCQIIQGRGEEP